MSNFKKRPKVIEAFQMTLERRWDNIDWPDWLNQAWSKDEGKGALWIHPSCPNKESLVCGTSDGPQCINFDDYIIKGSNGSIYSLEKQRFETIYEEVYRRLDA